MSIFTVLKMSNSATPKFVPSSAGTSIAYGPPKKERHDDKTYLNAKTFTYVTQNIIRLRDLKNTSRDANIYSHCSIECASRFPTKEADNFNFVSFPVSVDFQFHDHLVPMEKSVPNSNSRARFTILNTKFLHPNITLEGSKQDWPCHSFWFVGLIACTL